MMTDSFYCFILSYFDQFEPSVTTLRISPRYPSSRSVFTVIMLMPHLCVAKVNLVARERRNGLLIQSLMKLKINELLLKLFSEFARIVSA
jgi:hypothetical protein